MIRRTGSVQSRQRRGQETTADSGQERSRHDPDGAAHNPAVRSIWSYTESMEIESTEYSAVAVGYTPHSVSTHSPVGRDDRLIEMLEYGSDHGGRIPGQTDVLPVTSATISTI
ncbi:hypothetical protein VTN00DRAFT_9590 [Thermoascus crustaceus]|uniref:uncharacterized protein n=1 Tax=Thermoascus crustaceus TaxID=5088 RepID=UPI0037434E69